MCRVVAMHGKKTVPNLAIFFFFFQLGGHESSSEPATVGPLPDAVVTRWWVRPRSAAPGPPRCCADTADGPPGRPDPCGPSPGGWHPTAPATTVGSYRAPGSPGGSVV